MRGGWICVHKICVCVLSVLIVGGFARCLSLVIFQTQVFCLLLRAMEIVLLPPSDLDIRDMNEYVTRVRPFGYFETLSLGFNGFRSHLMDAMRLRQSLRQVAMERIGLANDVLDALFLRAMPLPQLERSEMLTGVEMNAAVFGMSVAVAAMTSVAEPDVFRSMVVSRPPLPICRPPIPSESAYLALTLCVLPKHRGYLESFEMDHAVRLVKAANLVDEYVMFTSYLGMHYGASWRTTGLPVRVRKLHRTLQESILMRLRRLSLAFLPIGSRNEAFHEILGRVRWMCQEAEDTDEYEEACDDHFQQCGYVYCDCGC